MEIQLKVIGFGTHIMTEILNTDELLINLGIDIIECKHKLSMGMFTQVIISSKNNLIINGIINSYKIKKILF